MDARMTVQQVNKYDDGGYSAGRRSGHTAVILSGGYSSRMRVNKAFLRLNGTPLIEIMLGKVSGFEEILIVTNSYADYAHLQSPAVRVIADIFPHKGPLSGIHAGLSLMNGDSAFVLPCDMPLLPKGVVRFMTELADARPASDVFAPEDGGLFQPLCAVYRKSCLARVEEGLREDRFKLQDLYARLNVYSVPAEELARFGDPEIFFGNANDPHCFEKIRRVAATRRWDSAYPVEVIV
jgi:molybdopterin-guanine dinucleotide biosynthesis protein A